MANQNPYSKKRLEFVDKSIRELSAQAQQLQRSFWETFLETVMLSLKVDGRRIENSENNIRIINSMAELMDGEIRSGDGQVFLEWYVGQLDELAGLNQKYFGNTEKVKEFALANRDRLLKLLGYNRGKVVAGSFLHTLIDFSDVYAQLQQILIGSIFTGLPFDTKGAKDFIVGTKAIPKPAPDGGPAPSGNLSGGAIEGALNSKTFDSFQQADRSLQQGIAADLGMNYAIYQGGLIKTSREFCIERNDRVFHRDEIEKFGTSEDKYEGYSDKSRGEFDGKTNPYNPFLDLGGYSCRHHLDWISDELAEILKEEEEGKARAGKLAKKKLEKRAKDVDPPHTPKNLNKYEKAVKTKVDRSIFSLLERPVDFNPKGIKSKSAYFSPSDNYVKISTGNRFTRSKWLGASVVYHEFGHAIDNQKGYYKSISIKSLMENHQKDYTDLSKKLMRLLRLGQKKKKFDAVEQLAATMDTMESLSRDPEGIFHSWVYWKKPGAKEKEFIAHMFENKYIGNPYFKRYLPKLYKEMLDFKLK